jgi:hypothetical protein
MTCTCQHMYVCVCVSSCQLTTHTIHIICIAALLHRSLAEALAALEAAERSAAGEGSGVSVSVAAAAAAAVDAVLARALADRLAG